MTFLVGDIGNTLTKICLINLNFKIIKSFSIKTNKLNKTKYQNIFFNKILKYKVNKKIILNQTLHLYKLLYVHNPFHAKLFQQRFYLYF